jgi:subtilisin family serine protease
VRSHWPLALLLATAGTIPVVASPAEAAPSTTGRYLVELSDAPIADYGGGVSGLAATKPAAGHKLDARSAPATAYGSYLARRRGDVLRKAKLSTGIEKSTMDVAFNGFSATLTATQADTLRHTAGVEKVYADTTVKVQSSDGPASYLGLTGPSGVWKQQFGAGSKAGAGVIVGVIDTGYTPQSASFAPLPQPRPDQAAIDARFKGVCDFGTAEPARCNDKVIGARWYNSAGFGTSDSDYLSPRDHNGHGTHTASTAAGDEGVKATVAGVPVGDITGMAPGARLAIYKVLWDSPQGEGIGSSIDIVDAVNDAVADGVDVLNYSVGDSSEMWSPADEAFFNAAAAGVFVAAAAGNDGPLENTVDNSLPWVTTVAATEEDHRWLRTITLGNGKTYTGVGFGASGTAKAPLIDSQDAAPDPTDDLQRYYASYCMPGSLDKTRVKGRVVLCARGENDRVEKGDVTAAAGSTGMIMYQPDWDPNTEVADIMALPSAHVDVATGDALLAYAKKREPTARLSPAKLTKVAGVSMAGFSSVGPSTLLNDSDLLKPDIAAPGVDVIAATSPNLSPSGFTLMSGTSMATPHIAGLAALVKSKHPDWGPTVIRSALMTSSFDGPIKQIDHPANPLNFGAGEVRPGGAFDPGLVYESTPQQWLRYLCGVYAARGEAVGLGMNGCDQIGSIATDELNYPSVSFGHMVGTQTVTRTVTNVSGSTGVYTAHIQAPKGYSVRVSPSTIVVKPGASAGFQVTLTHAGGSFDAWNSGSLTWRDGRGHDVRIPLVLKNTALVAADSVTASGTSGSQALPVQVGWSGRLNFSPVGLTSGKTTAFRLSGADASWDDQLSGVPNPLPSSMQRYNLHVPAGAVAPAVRVDSQYPRCSDDEDDPLVPCGDFYAKVFGPDGSFVAADFMHSPHTSTLDLPDGAGDYTLVVEQVDEENLPAGQTGQQYSYTLFTPGVPGTGAGHFTVDPGSRPVTAGASTSATLHWSGLTAGTTYRGMLLVGDGHTERKRIPVSVTG